MNGDKNKPKPEPVALDIEHIKSLLRHVDNVRDACILLAERLIKQDEVQFARILISNSLLHDASKFKGIEWEDLRVGGDSDKLKAAYVQHISTNPHHPEYWGGIKNMPRIYIAEMVCDWFARSSEAATDLRAWIKNEAIPKYKMSPQGKTYKVIKEFVDILLDKPLTRIT